MDTNPFNAFAGAGILVAIIGIVIYLVIIAIGIWISWAVIRSAVRRALRDHQNWLESRGMR